MKRLPFLSFCLLLSSFAFAQDQPAMTQTVPACGPSDVRFQVKKNQSQPQVPALETDSARVYVIEDWFSQGAADPLIRVGVDGRWVAASQGNSWSTFTVPAGEHHLCTDWQPGPIHSEGDRALYGFRADADSTYYFRVRFAAVSDGGYTNSYGILLEAINPDEGQYLLSQFPQAIATSKK